MKIFTLFIVFLSALFLQVKANNNAIGDEVMYYYYVYKMQYESGGPMTIATGCRPADGRGGTCYFDEFVRHIMAKNFVRLYRPSPGDHTRTPDLTNLASFKAVNVPKARYRLEKLCTEFATVTGNAAGGTGNIAQRDRSMTRLIEIMLNAANTAIDARPARVALSDAQMAAHMAQQTLWDRGPDASKEMYNWLDEQLTPAEQDYLDSHRDIINWDQSLVNVDQASQQEK